MVWHRLSGLVRVGGAGRRTNRSWDFCCSFVPWPQACNCQQPPFCYRQPEALAVAARKSRSLGNELRNAMGTTTAYLWSTSLLRITSAQTPGLLSLVGPSPVHYPWNTQGQRPGSSPGE